MDNKIDKGVYIPKNLTQVEFQHLHKVSQDVFAFCQEVSVVHPMRGRVKFELYPYQKLVLWNFLRERFNIILKFRQAGVTELMAMYCLWLALYHPLVNILIISIKDRVAKRVLKRIKYMYKNLPNHLKTPIINGRPGELGTAVDMEFSNGSLITSIPTTEDAGRSEAVTLLVIDEAAIIRWANTIWASLFPTLSTGGSAIVASCVTGDTEIIGRAGNFRIDTICPKTFGKKDISNLGLKVLSHKGQWQSVIGAVNKGKLETWEIKNKFGDTLKCTPHHKLYTPWGWRTVKEIIKRDLDIIVYNPGLHKLRPYPITIPPEKEVIKPIEGFPNYSISNLGKIYISKNGNLIEKESRPSNRQVASGGRYYSTALWNRGNKKKRALHNLVAETFLGTIPKGYVVDHINGNPEDNYVTNLEIVTISENGLRATLYSRGLRLGSQIGKGFANIKLIGKIRSLTLKGKSRSELITKYNIQESYITRVLSNSRVKSVQISKLILVRKYIDTIYDICVENDESYITGNHYINHNTPFGMGNWYHKTYTDALSGGNPFYPMRLRWDMHPERDLAWYNNMAQALGPRRTAQEIDGDFLSSGYSVFDLVDIKAIEESLSDFIVIESLMNGALQIVKEPQRGISFYIGADVATGRSHDYSTFSIMDRAGEEYAYFKGKISTSAFADLLMKYGKKYNNALVAPETNDIGEAVTRIMQREGYPNLYYFTKLLKAKGERKPKEEKFPGWLTTSKNRGLIIDELEEDVRNDTVIIKDPFFVQEAYTFIYDNSNRPVALGKENRNINADDDNDQSFTDDAIMAKAITNFVRKGRLSTVVVAPQ